MRFARRLAVLSTFGTLAASLGILPAALAASFDIATLEAPAGFAEERSGDHLGFTRIDRQAGTYCQIALYASRAARDPLQQEFRLEWQQLAVQQQTADLPQTESGTSAKGIAWVAAEQQVSRGGMTFRTRLYTLQADKAVLSVLVNASNADALRQCRPALDALLASISLPTAAAKPPSAPANPVAAGANAGKFRGAGIAGVWMGFESNYAVTRSYEPRPQWIVLFDDGTAFRNLPNGGLLAFDRAAARVKLPHSFASWSFSNGSGRVRLGGDPKFDIKLAAGKKDGQLQLDGSLYHRLAEVDGLRLSGEWTSYADPHDPRLDQLEAGKRPVIRFTREGRFADDGVFATILQSYANPAENFTGSGRYAIKDYTLTLRYDDGRARSVAFGGFLGANPAADDKYLYIERVQFRKRN